LESIYNTRITQLESDYKESEMKSESLLAKLSALQSTVECERSLVQDKETEVRASLKAYESMVDDKMEIISSQNERLSELKNTLAVQQTQLLQLRVSMQA
jgi:small-conductance mechanosensitive channel